MTAPNVYLVSPVSADMAPHGVPPYAAALGLSASPFPVTPDEINYFFTPQTEAIYEEVSHFIAMRKGFLLLTGEIGLGKTTLLRRLLATFDKAQYNTALILTSFLDQTELLEMIGRDFGLQLPAQARRIDYLAELNRFLLTEAAKGKINVLFIDDAQALDVHALDVVRQLSNLETAQSKLIQIVLCGQPELLDTLSQYGMRQVRSRIALHRRLQPLDREQLYAYVQHRMAKAGRAQSLPITADGLQSLHEWTAGFPRRIHHLMDRCLYGLLVGGSSTVDRDLVLRAVEDLGWQIPTAGHGAGASSPPRNWLRRHGLTVLMILAVAAASAVGVRLLMDDMALPVPKAANKGTSVKPVPAPVRAVVPATITEPSDWSTARASFPGLWAMAWPVAASINGLTEELRNAPQMYAWQVLIAQGEWVQSCAERPMLDVTDLQGKSWRLSFVEAQWPTAPVAMGQSSEAVRHLQQFMVRRGWLDKSAVDAVMGPRTAYALSQFQRDQGLTTTGQFSQDTAYRLSCVLSHNARQSAGGPQ